MIRYRVFISDLGKYKDPSKYEFIAEFEDMSLTESYTKHMRRSWMYKYKDIIIKEVETDGCSAEEGRINTAISVLGEYLFLNGEELL